MVSTAANEVPDHGIIVTTDDAPDGMTSSGAEMTVEQAEEVTRLHQIRQRFMVHQTFWSQIFSEGLEDDKFVAGEQWPDDVRKEREEDRRPVLTYNLFPAFNRQIVNKVRETRAQIKVSPTESNKGPNPQLANVGGTKDYSLADVYSGLIKNTEHASRADQAYDTAVKHAVDHGFGYFYLMNEWSRIDPFVQDLRIHRVKNSYTITMDPDAQEADYRDAQDAFMFTRLKRTTFRFKYPDAAEHEFTQTGMGASYEGWYDPENILVAQYFWIDWRDDEVLQLSNGKLVYNSVVESVLDELEQDEGIHIAKDDDGDEMRKKVKRPVCMWQKMTANEVLEGPLDLPFSAIPIFPVLGEEVVIDGRTRYESAIRHAKDAARSYNYWRTAAAETVALAPRAPWVATERQVAGYEEMYEDANTKNIPLLLYNHQDGQNPPPPPQRQFPSQVAAAELQNAIADAGDMQTIIGLHEASLGAESNEKSGKAIKARQSQGATSTFQFPDNLRRAQEQCGRLMVEAFPQLMDTQRIVRIRLPDDTDDFVEINKSIKDGDSGKTVLVHDIAYGKYDVVMDQGPDYATQRDEAAELQMELLKVLGPDQARNIVHLVVKNLGVPGSSEVAAILRKMLPEALKTEDEKIADLPKGVTPDPENEGQFIKNGEPWTPPPTLEQQLMQKQQEIDELKHNGEIAKHEGVKATAAAKTKEAEADIAKAQAEMAALQQQPGGDQAQENVNQLQEIQSIIQGVMEEHEAKADAHKSSTEEMIATAVVEALRRTKAYVDKRAPNEPEAKETAPAVVEAPGDVHIRVENLERKDGEITNADIIVLADRG